MMPTGRLARSQVWTLDASVPLRFEIVADQTFSITRMDDGTTLEVPLADLPDLLRAVSGIAAAAGKRSRGAREAERLRDRFPNAYAPWSKGNDDALLAMVRRGATTAEMALEFGRQPSAIRSRIAKLTERPMGSSGV